MALVAVVVATARHDINDYSSPGSGGFLGGEAAVEAATCSTQEMAATLVVVVVLAVTTAAASPTTTQLQQLLHLQPIDKWVALVAIRVVIVHQKLL